MVLDLRKRDTITVNLEPVSEYMRIGLLKTTAWGSTIPLEILQESSGLARTRSRKGPPNHFRLSVSHTWGQWNNLWMTVSRSPQYGHAPSVRNPRRLVFVLLRIRLRQVGLNIVSQATAAHNGHGW